MRLPFRDAAGPGRLSILKAAAVAVAFAVWCFLPLWVNLAEGDQMYFARFPPARAVLLPALWLHAAIAAAIFLASELRRRRWVRAAQWDRVFLIGCLIPLGAASVAMLRLLPVDAAPVVRHPAFWPVLGVIAVIPGVRILWRPAASSRILRSALFYSWPVLALVMAQAARQSRRFPDSAFRDSALAPGVSATPQRRVVWIVFDELSEEMAFRRRPSSLRLPAFDRLRSESFFADAARSPSAATLTSLPSLILGRHVRTAEPQGPAGLSLTVDGETAPVDWRAAPNVFDAARKMGYNTAVAGWYHPYGRVLNRSLTRCDWVAGWLAPGIEEPSTAQPLAAAMSERVQLEIAMLPLLGHLPGVDPELLGRRARLERLLDLLGRAEAAAADPSIGLALLHLPAPHPPTVYDRAAGRFTAERRLSYLDGLASADELLRRIRDAIGRAGMADRTVLLVSSDHGWRQDFWRGRNVWAPEDDEAAPTDPSAVPFLLHFPGESAPVDYASPFETVASRNLIEAILDGRVASAADAARFLEIRIRSAR